MRTTIATIAARLGYSRRTVFRMLERGELAGVRPRKQGRPLELEPRTLELLDGARVVRVPGHVWRALLEVLPAATPATLAHEVAGALRAAAYGAGIGRRRVAVNSDGSLTRGSESGDRSAPPKAARRR